MENTLFKILENRVKEKTSSIAQRCCVPYCTNDSRYRTTKLMVSQIPNEEVMAEGMGCQDPSR